MRSIVFFISVILLLYGCSASAPAPETVNKGTVKFTSDEFGFSFDYPAEWNPVDKGLPNNWAAQKGLDTIVFTVNDLQAADILTLGRIQALRDLRPADSTEQIDPASVAAVTNIVREAEYGTSKWYTYAIHFSEQNVDSIVSGTICNDKEITLVLVSNVNTIDINTLQYTHILESFECSQNS